MFTYKQTIKKLLNSEHKELFNKLDFQDYELLFCHKDLGLFSQIKKQLEKGDKFYVDIPKVGRFSIKPNKIIYKINYFNKCVLNEEKKLQSDLLLIKEKENHSKKLVEYRGELSFWLNLLIERYDYYEEEKRMNMKKAEVKERLHIDPIKRDLVIELLKDRELSVESFIFNIKRINTPLTKGLFLVALANINDVILKRKKMDAKKIAKAEFLKLLKSENIYVEND